MRFFGIPLLLFVVGGCAGQRHLVPLLGAAGVPLTPPAASTLEILTRSTAVSDPVPVRGIDVAYTDVELALGHAVAAATVPWATNHGSTLAGPGWQLFVEMTNADAEYEDGRTVFTLGVRATLRARAGNVYLAQTQAACRQGGVVPPDEGALVMYRCMTEIGHHLANWLDGVELEAVAPPRPQ